MNRKSNDFLGNFTFRAIFCLSVVFAFVIVSRPRSFAIHPSVRLLVGSFVRLFVRAGDSNEWHRSDVDVTNKHLLNAGSPRVSFSFILALHGPTTMASPQQ